MIRPSTLLWLVAVIIVGWAMFQVKYEVVQQETEIARVDRRIADGREAIRVLDAEWSFLSQPTRLNELAKHYLNLLPIGSAQLLTSLAQLPMRSIAPGAGWAAPAAPAGRTEPRLATVKSSVDR